MNTCPCCSHILLRQFRHQQIHWFCRNCWQDMPLLNRGTVGLMPRLSVDTPDTSMRQLQRSLATV